MFASRYFNPRYWASRFFPKVGLDLTEGEVCYLSRTAALSAGPHAIASSMSGTAVIASSIDPVAAITSELC